MSCCWYNESDVMQCTSTLATALQIAAKDDREREKIRQSHQENFKHGLNPYSAPSAVRDGNLKPVENLKVVYSESGEVTLSWEDDKNVKKQVDYYQLEINHDERSLLFKERIQSDYRQYHAKSLVFRPLQRYTIKMCAIGGKGSICSPWSDSIIVRVPKAPPNTPSCCPELITYFCSSSDSSDGDVDSVKLSIPYPTQDDCNGKPLTKMILYYSDENMAKLSSLVLENPASPSTTTSDKLIFNVRRFNFDLEHTFRITWVNECGESGHSSAVTLNKRNANPGTPGTVRESTKKTNNILKIRWKKPPVNAFAVDHYEVHMMDKDGGFHAISGDTIYKCSATIRKLNQNTKYLFRVCSVGQNGTKSSFTPEITITTNICDAAKGTLGGLGVAGGIVGGVGFGAVSGPVLGVGAGITAGILAADKVDNKVGKAIVGTLAGIGAGIPSIIGFTLATPFTMIAAPVALATTSVLVTKDAMEDDWSEQSSDEEDEKQKKKAG